MLAIIIPYFKREYFEECLDSLAKQTIKNFKVYIGDDASPEDPVEIIEKFNERLNISYHRFNENLGGISLTKQWDRCINLTQDEKWLMILGDDDYLSDNYIEKFQFHLREINNLNIKVVHFASRIVRSPGGKISKLYTHPKIENSTDFFYRKFLKFSRGSLTEQIFRRDAYNKHGFRDFPLAWGADNFAWLDFTDFGPIYSINTAVAFFRISDYNISRGGYEDKLKQTTKYNYFTLIIEKYLQKFKKPQRKPLLLFYEQIVYNTGRAGWGFFFTFLKFLYKEHEYIEMIKFTRRIFIHKYK
ncbi:glycosyltransferase family 2 protein [Zunongwangia sp. F363]|uniref:Glycosyltransferase family 2 protein n=1 Tax=Autumnicola tepida TaxID=3075595 RepID=A0ABU3C9N7_9FLAO|nr:glycosyltransferase family 2 protein [Zunongwangia sp. F363]MDT0643052.1 glycosyltransferase family 2 protein [Zunongwangia sp. F363]